MARNVIAGIIVGIVAIPLAMAFAIASGARPEQGLYTAVFAGIAVTLFGGSRVQIAGPTGAFVVLLAGVSARYGTAGLAISAIIAGLLLILFGTARLGGVIRYVPESVIMGFTAGIAVVIFVGQWSNFFGLPAPAGDRFLEKLAFLAAHLSQLDPATTLLGLASLAVVVLWPRTPKLNVIPSPLVALVGATVFVAIARPESVATIGSAFGGIPRGLPSVTLPKLSLAEVTELIRPAFAIALLGAIESLLSATVADGMAHTRHDPNQELIGQGIGNVLAGLVGGIPATGALARTATSVRHGGNSPLAGMVHAATVAMVLLVLAPLASWVPLSALAAILFVVAYNMSDLGRVVRVARTAPASDAGVMLITLVLAVFTDLVTAVEVGVVLALLNFFRRMTQAVDVSAVEAALACEIPGQLDVPEDVIVYTIDGPFFFGAIEQFEAALLHTNTEPRGVIISMTNVPFVDLTALVALKEALTRLQKHHVRIAIAEASPAVAERIERAGVLAGIELPATASLTEALAYVAGDGPRAGTPASNRA
ncbi:SulP family inorganic anion transporter [Parvivirga hydrogeniphila]